jgi:hypothetical protein
MKATPMEARDDNRPWPNGISRINRLYYYKAWKKNKTAWLAAIRLFS